MLTRGISPAVNSVVALLFLELVFAFFHVLIFIMYASMSVSNQTGVVYIYIYLIKLLEKTDILILW